MNKIKGVTFESGFSKYVKKDGTISTHEYNRYRASVWVNGKTLRLGCFKTEKEAIKCIKNYNKAKN